MTAFPGGGQPRGDLPATAPYFALAGVRLPALRALLRPTALVVVGGFVGATLPVELPVQAAERQGVRGYLRAERLQDCLPLAHDGQGTQSQVQPHDPGAQLMVGLRVGPALTDRLSGNTAARAELA